MSSNSSRRNFLAAGLALPGAGLAAGSPMPSPLSSPAGSPAAEPKLEYRALGNTGLKVTSLSVGSRMASDPAVVEAAIDQGINYFDTARGYSGGNDERMLGVAIRGKRDKVLIATKSSAGDKKTMLEQLDTSLTELGTDYVDVWFMHKKHAPAEVKDELLEAQEIARKAGKIRFRGMSFHFNMPEMLECSVKLGCIDVALLTYNFIVGDEVGPALEKARQAGLGTVAMKVMAGGYKRIQRGDRLYGQDKDELTAKLKQPNAMLSTLKYVIRNKSVDTAVVGITDFRQLHEDMRAMSEPFGEVDEKLLAQQRRDIQPLYCHACGKCSGVCERGVRVADTQRQLMYAEGYGQFAMAREDYLNQPSAARAVNCSDCAVCSVQCPNGVDVQANLIRAQQLFG